MRTPGLAFAGAGDREWMVVDRDGRFLTQREHPALALVRTELRDEALTLRADGASPLRIPLEARERASSEVVVWRSRVRGFDEGPIAGDWLSARLGAAVRLVRFDRSLPRPCNEAYAGDSGAHTLFADGYPLLVVGSASLDELNARLDERGAPSLPMDRFRPNLVLDGLDAHAEDHLDTITIAAVTLRLVKPCTRCQVTTTDQATGAVGVEPLRTLAGYRTDDRFGGVTFGMNAIVVGEGAIAVGDAARVEYRF